MPAAKPDIARAYDPGLDRGERHCPVGEIIARAVAAVGIGADGSAQNTEPSAVEVLARGYRVRAPLKFRGDLHEWTRTVEAALPRAELRDHGEDLRGYFATVAL